jgi:hypothetical protein
LGASDSNKIALFQFCGESVCCNAVAAITINSSKAGLRQCLLASHPEAVEYPEDFPGVEKAIPPRIFRHGKNSGFRHRLRCRVGRGIADAEFSYASSTVKTGFVTAYSTRRWTNAVRPDAREMRLPLRLQRLKPVQSLEVFLRRRGDECELPRNNDHLEATLYRNALVPDFNLAPSACRRGRRALIADAAWPGARYHPRRGAKEVRFAGLVPAFYPPIAKASGVSA